MCDFRIIACECCGGDRGWLEGDRWQACTACDDGQVEIVVQQVEDGGFGVTSKWENFACNECQRTVPVEEVEEGLCEACRQPTPKIRYWWSEDRQWFCIEVNDGVNRATVSLNHEEAAALADESIMTPQWMALLGRSWDNVVSLLEKRRTSALTSEERRGLETNRRDA